MLKPIVIDFETEAIQNRPRYPPKPVGFSIKRPEDKKAFYYSWGHPMENNCDESKARRVLKDAWKSGEPLLFHNAKFDVDVAQTWMGCGDIAWDRVHDSMFQIYLVDPHASTFSLKPSAERILGMKPTERDAVMEWLIEHQPAAETRITKSNWGAFICLAPGSLVGKYADGDVKRTLRLFNKLEPSIRRDGMEEAYNRERQIMPIFLENERAGLRVDLRGLIRDEKMYAEALEKVDDWLAKRLKWKGLDVGNDKEMADALERSGVVTEFGTTATGKRSVAKDSLTVDKFHDPKIAQAFFYRNKLSTCLTTFFRPWIELASLDDGYIHPNWNQVRQARGKGSGGTRTGRPSMYNPNLLNVPKTFDDKNDGYVHPAFLSIPELPLMRRYILPDPGELFGHRDYNQQELRILAHFEDDELLKAYLANPKLDMHTFVQGEIKRINGAELERRAVKILNFGMIYGMGLGALANDLKCGVDEAKTIKAAQRAAMPSLAALERAIRQIGDDGECITTWGGRRYFAEKPQIVDGRMRSFSYKLLNYLIQGSAADCTKQAIINYHERKKEGRFLVTVYDEINISAPKAAMKKEMDILRDCMADVNFDVPMLSDGKTGPNWADMKKEK
jgi:DNA polymerase I-like protein with 3'-5' exonuclease and polymerase domains